MKKLIALLLVLATLLCAMPACEKKPEPTSGETTSETSETSEPATPVLSVNGIEKMIDVSVAPFSYGVYYLRNDDGKYLATSDTNSKVLLNDGQGKNESYARWTLYYRRSGETVGYSIFRGDDTRNCLKAGSPAPGASVARNGTFAANKNNTFTFVPNADGSKYQIQLTDRPEVCVSYDTDGSIVLGESGEKGTWWTVETAAPSEDYVQFISKNKHIALRVKPQWMKLHSMGLSEELLQQYIDYFELAYEAEIELTGFVPYDVIEICCYKPRDFVAAVTNDYNVIMSSDGYSEKTLAMLSKRLKQHNVFEMDFGLLHEMGHMFDMGRGWNFESEAWTDYKMCYALKRLQETYPDVTFTATPTNTPAKEYYTYDTMEVILGCHDNEKEGGMTKYYAFFGCAKIFLLFAKEFGWEQAIATFHWFQENNETDKTLKDRISRFEKWVEIESEMSGINVKGWIDQQNPKAWRVLVDYMSGVTDKAI